MASFFLQLKQLLFGTGVPSKNGKQKSSDDESYAENDADTDNGTDNDTDNDTSDDGGDFDDD